MKRKLLLISFAAFSIAAMCQSTGDGTTHSKYIQAVDEYVPAPGQFVNVLPAYVKGDDAASMAQKCTKALANNARGMITLGAYGGYVTFHFDHSVANIKGKNDLYISGNAFTGSSEPGIVMVSKDDNNNGIADDKWYELSGSADVDSVGKVTYNYEITYSIDSLKDVPWTDNTGNSGKVTRNNFHRQEYYPLWLPSSTTFKGTLLPKNAYDKSGRGTYWVLQAFRYGYVDNAANSDSTGCSFNIDWAVDEQRQHVDLDKVDFIRVYNAENQMAGWLGETSTEVTGAEDLHLDESLAAAEAEKRAPKVVAEDITAAYGETVSLKATVTDGKKPYTIVWRNGKHDVVEQTLVPQECDDYTVTVTDANGKEAKDTCRVIITGKAITATFENLYLEPESSWNGADMTGSFVSGSYLFNNGNMPEWYYWYDFAYSNRTSKVYNVLDDQFNSAVGCGVNNSANYAVAYPQGGSVKVLSSEDGDTIRGFYITNGAWNVRSYTVGDDMTPGAFAEGDYFKVTITGTHADGTTSTMDYYLADYRQKFDYNRYYLDTWQWVDTRSLGKVTNMTFTMSSSRKNDYGMTTPAYFFMDDFNGERNIKVVDTQSSSQAIDLNPFFTFDDENAKVTYAITDYPEGIAKAEIELNEFGYLTVDSSVKKFDIIISATQKGKIQFVKIPFDVMTGINSTVEKDSTIDSYYTIDGKKVDNPQRGIYIVRMKNGTTHKVTFK